MQQAIFTVIFLLLISFTCAFHTQQQQPQQQPQRISRSSSHCDALMPSPLYYKPAPRDEEGVNEKEAEEETSLSKNQNTEIADKGSLFMSQMASNINQKVEEAHPTILSAKDSAEKINMDELDTKAKMKQWAGKYDKAAMQAKLQDRIATNPVFLLTYGTCPYCAKVINALKTYSAADAATGSNGDSNGGVIERQKMLIVDLDALPGLEKYALRTEVMELVDHNTIPALWVGGQFVGGYQQLEALQQQGNQEDGKDQFKILLEEAMNMNVNVNVNVDM